MTMAFEMGYELGTGSAINVELGWRPDLVIALNATDADEIFLGVLGGNKQIIPFSGGGTTAIAAGDTIVGVTSGAEAFVERVLLASGSWAGGDAAGFFIVRGVTGTFQSENVDNVDGSSDFATVTVNVNHTVSIKDTGSGATDLALETHAGNESITKYNGSAGSASVGFTLGSGISESGKLLVWFAFRSA